MMTKNNQNKYLFHIQKQTFRFAIILIVISMFTNIFTVNQASAYFSDEATIEGNTFTAGTLAFHLNPATNFTPNSLNKGGTASYETTITNDGSLGFQYTIKTTDMSGDANLCNSLILNASLNNTSVYNDSLSSFTSTSTNYTNPSAWDFVVTLPNEVNDTMQDKTCNFKFTFNGWQENLYPTEGFSDNQQINGIITSGHWVVAPEISGIVLNEFLPNPNGNENSEVKPDGEWIELYNLSANNSVNIAGYYLSDQTNSNGNGHRIDVENCRTNTGDTIIGPHEFLVIYTNAGSSCNDHGFNLNNTGGDEINLYDNTDHLIDSYTYIVDAPENKSFARIPDGTGAWVDPIPTPGEPNELVPVVIKQSIVKVVIPETQSIIIDNDSITTDTMIKDPEIVTEGDRVEQETTNPIVSPTIDKNEAIETKSTTEPKEVDSTKEEVASEEPKKDESAVETAVVMSVEIPASE